MKKIFTLFALCLLLNTANAQTNTLYQWSGVINNSSSSSFSENAVGVVADASGNIYTAGYFAGTVDFDHTAGVTNLTASGTQDIFIAKYNSSGALQFAYKIGTATSGDDCQAIAIDGSGNIYISGNVPASTDFNPGAGTNNLTGQYMAKYNSSGTFVAVAAIPMAFDIFIDGSNNVFITGSLTGTVDFNPSASTNNLTAVGSSDIFVAKYTSALAYSTAFSLPGTAGNDAYGTGIVTDNSGNILICGYFNSTVDFNPGAGTNSLTASNDMFYAKYTSAGAYVYANRIASSKGITVNDIAADASGNAYITGHYGQCTFSCGSVGATVDFDPGAGTANLTASSTTSASPFYAKYDASGNYMFAANAYSSTGVGYRIIVENSHFYVSTGSSFNGLYIMKFALDGTNVYRQNISPPTWGGFTVRNGTMYLMGESSLTEDVDPNTTTANITANSNDIFIVKYKEVSLATGTITTSALCPGDAVAVPFTVTDNLPAGNVFTAQISNSSGSFSSPTSIGTLTSTTSGTVNATIPLSIPPGSGYRIRVTSTIPAINGSDNGTNISIPSTCPAYFNTKWNLATSGSGTTQISFGVGTTGTVRYSWEEITPGTATGTGAFSGSTATITGLPVGSTIRLSIAPTNFNRININNGTDRNRLVDVEQWGSVAWASMATAFYGCANLNITATAVPNLSAVTSMASMFRFCSSLNSPANIGSWNTSAVTSMGGMFQSASSFNQNISTWNTAIVSNMANMFFGATAFNQNLGSWNTSLVTSMAGMFFGATAFNQNIGSWNTSGVTDMSAMFSGATAFN